MAAAAAAVLVASYLLGAIPFGLLVGRARGVDPRQAGSGNIGATNVARTAGFGWGLLTFALDFAKGAVAPIGAALGAPGLAWLPAAAGLAALLGHVFPVYLGFKGGKGVATAAGVFAALAPLPLVIALAGFGAVAGLTRVVALGSMASALALVIACFATGTPWAARGLAIAAAALIFARHASNIRRLVERRGQAAANAPPDASPGASAGEAPDREAPS